MAIYDVIDISEYQNSVSSYSAAANEVDGVIMRCGYRGYGSAGTLVKDDLLETHYSGFEGKTKIGYYFFTQAITEAEAEEEAEYVVNTLIAGKDCDFPIYWDTEASGGSPGRADGLSPTQRTACCIAFINKIKALGYRAGVYASENWFETELNFNQILATGASIWCAKYSSQSPEIDEYDGWQFTSSSSVSGIAGNIDRSRFYKDVAGWDSDVPVTGVTLNKNTLSLNAGSTETLVATITPSDATNKNVSWTSSNNSVATVNSNGKVDAVGNGSCTITVTTQDGGFTASCTVNVSTAVTGVTLNKNSMSLFIGSSETLIATVLPSTASDKSVVWTSSNFSVASVDAYGNVTAKSAGSAIITVTTVNGSKTATCNVTVNNIPVESVTLDKSELNLDISDSYTLTPTVLPSNATNKNVTWSSSADSIAIVDSNGTITPKKNGICNITVTTVDGGKTATCRVTITTKITGIHLNETSKKIEKNNDFQLDVIFEPATATPKPVSWSSSDTSIATVDNTGKVTAIKTGKVNITATVVDGKTFTATCQVSVVVYPTSISLNIHEIEKHILDETPIETLNYTILPEDSTEKDIHWQTTNINIAEINVSNNKIIYNGNPGSCYISVITENNIKDSCKINVYKRLPKPNSPILVENTKTSISLLLEDGMEYSNTNGASYQISNTFDNLEPNTSYKFIQRRMGHDYYIESEPSAELTVSTRDIVHVESVSLNTHVLELRIDDQYKEYYFNTTILPVNAEIKSIFYSVSDQSIGTIDPNGKLTVREPGYLIVSVTSVDGGFIDTCKVAVYKKWDKPDPPTVLYVSSNSIILDKPSNNILYSIDGGSVWTPNNEIKDLKEKTTYSIICKLKEDVDAYRLESSISSPTYVKTLDYDPEPSDRDVHPEKVTLSAHKLYFDLEKNLHATLNYTISPINTTNKSIIWSSENDKIIKVNINGELTAVGVGRCNVIIKTIDGQKSDYCECFVYKVPSPPDKPETVNIGIYEVQLKNMGEDIEYSIDGTTWTSNTLFNNLADDSYYTFYQRYKGVGDYQPPSDPSVGLTVKTLPKEKPSGTSPSGYKWGQQVEINSIPIYPSPYSRNSTFKLSGNYYIFSISESNNRIRITDNEDFIDVRGHSLGWVNINDLKLIETDIYVGDKVIVSGNINIYADGSGAFIYKEKDEMYVTDIIEGYEYSYGVTDKAGKHRVGFAKPDMVKKYTIIGV